MFCFLGPRHEGSQPPHQGLNQDSPALEGKVLFFFFFGRQSLNHWTSREVLWQATFSFCKQLLKMKSRIENRMEKKERMDPMWRRIIWGNFCFSCICMCVCLHPYASLCIWTVSQWVLVLKTEKNTSLEKSHCFQGQIEGSWSQQDENSV